MRVAVFGPTAVGKTEFAIALAQRIGGEIVNADAVQLYRGFDRGSAKPPLGERGGVAHHLLDIADPEMPVSVAVYQKLAEHAIREIERRGRVAVITGGSGLYLRAALGEWRAFGSPPQEDVRSWATQASLEELRARALAADPGAAARISPRDRPRLVRVIERAQAGVSPRVQSPLPQPVLKIGLQRPRKDLYARIDERCALLWPLLLEETAALAARGEQAKALVQRTIGYREALEAMRGERQADEAIALLRQNTRRLAKRQLTWWRREPSTIWVRPDDGLAQLGPTLSVLYAH